MNKLEHLILTVAALFGACLACVLFPEGVQAAWNGEGNAGAFLADPASGRSCLSVSRENGEVVLQKTLAPEERFILRHRHSVHKSLVVEYLAPGPGGTVAVLAGEYADFGAGLPQKAEEGQRIEFSDGKARLVTASSARFPRIEVRVGRIAEHTIIVQQKEYPLAEFISPGMVAILQISEKVCPDEYP